MNKHGILLDVVQVLADVNLVITKAYISSDGVWFMDGKLFPCQLIDLPLYLFSASIFPFLLRPTSIFSV